MGAISAILFFIVPSTSTIWPIVGLLACGANVGFGASFVALNSYLPNLARETKEVREAWQNLVSFRSQQQDGVTSGDAAPFTEGMPEQVYKSVLARATARISSFGIAMGYMAGVLLMIGITVPVAALHSSTLSLRLAIGGTGLWWAIGSIPAGIWLPSGSTLKLVEGADLVVGEVDKRPWNFSREILNAWKRLGVMLRWSEIKRLRNTFWYLSAWFLLSDGMFFYIRSPKNKCTTHSRQDSRPFLLQRFFLGKLALTCHHPNSSLLVPLHLLVAWLVL